jgi:hypothetical protein
MNNMQRKVSKLLVGASLMSLVATQVAIAQQYPAAVLDKSPVGYWRLNETGTVLPAALATNIGTVGSAGNGTYFEVNKGVTGIPGGGGNTAASLPGLVDGNRVSRRGCV